MKLRPYQQSAVDGILAELGENRSTLCVLPTGCVSGDTVLGINRAGKGYSRTIAKAYAKQSDPRVNRAIQTQVRAFLGSRIGLHASQCFVYSGEQETLTLTLDNGKQIRATAEHDVLTEDGFVPLAALTNRDRVLCEADPQTGRSRKPKPYYRQVQGLRLHPFASKVIAAGEGELNRVPLHRLVAESVLNGVDLDFLVAMCRGKAKWVDGFKFLDPKVWAVHHIDGNHLNNAAENLQVLTHSEHHRLHGETDKLANLGFGKISASFVRRVERFGVEPTYDVVCDDPHRNFVANGIVVHNCGKTVVFSHVIKNWPANQRVLVLAHREELIRQAAAKIFNVTGEQPAIEMADERADFGLYRKDRVVVSSIQTQIAGRSDRKRMHRFKPEDFGLVIVDEAHHIIAKSYRKVIDHYFANEQCKLLGVTATPDRADEQALGKVFGSVAYVYEIVNAINDGWLVPITQRSVRIKGLDYSKVHTTAGDLNGAELAEVLEDERMLQEVAGPTMELAQWRKCLVFSPSVKHAERLAEIFNRRRRDCARWVCGQTASATRRQTLNDYADGRFQFLVNVGVFTEGFDEPTIDMIVMARPTKSRALFSQMVGRGTRPLPGVVDGLGDAEARRDAIARSRKPSMTVLDFEGNCGTHKLVTTADILGGNYDDDVVSRAAKKAAEASQKAKGKEINIADMLELAKREIDEEKERAKAKRKYILAQVEYSTKEVSAFDVMDIEPPQRRGWDMTIPPSDKQREFLERAGVPVPKTKREAHALIEDVMVRRDKGLCTYKQSKILKKYGYDSRTSFTKAREIIDSLAANGWKRPAEVVA